MLINPLHEKFVVLYLTTARYNASEAYRQTYGTTGASAWVGGCRLKKRPEVAKEINRRFKAQLVELEEPAREIARNTVAALLRGR